MVDANVRLAGRVLVGALALVAVAAVVPGWLKRPDPAPVREGEVPATQETTRPTILHAVEGYEGTPSPLPQSGITPASRERGFEVSPAASSAALITVDDPELR